MRLERCDEGRLYSLDHLDEFLPPEPDGRSGISFQVDEEIPEGGRNTHLYKLARSLKTRGLRESEILEVVTTVNRKRCRPPLDSAEVDALVRHAHEQPDRQFTKSPEFLTKHSETRQVDEWPVLNQVALHGISGEVVRLLEPHTESDPVALLVSLLSEAGAMFNRARHLILDGTFHPLLFWPVLVGQSSKSRKGTAGKRIHTILSLADSTWTRGEAKGTLSSGEGLAFAVRDPQYKQEPVKRRGEMTGETTTVCIDPGVEDKRLFLVQPEFGAVLRVMAREGNSLSGVLRDAWDGLTLAPMTKANRVRATDPHIAITGHVTKDELLRNLTDTEVSNGFGNRFTFLVVKRSKELPFPSSPSEADVNRLATEMGRMLQHARRCAAIRFHRHST